MRDRIIELVAAVRETQQAAELYRNHKNVALSGLDGTVKAVFLAALRSLLCPAGTLVLVVPGRDAIREYRQALSFLYPDLPAQELYPVNLPRVQAETRNLEIQAGRAAALRLIHHDEAGVVFVTAEAWMQRLPSPAGMGKGSVDLRRGEIRDQGALVEALVGSGYERTDEVDAIGQFSVRGEILDIFPLNSGQPVRVEWYDDTIDDLRPFDLVTKRSTGSVDSLRILPLRKADDDVWESFLWEYGTDDTLFVLDEPTQLLDTVERLYKEATDFRADVWTAEELEQQAGEAQVLTVSALEGSRFPSFERIAVPVRKAASYNRSLPLLVEDLGNLLSEGVRPYLMMSTVLKARSVAESLREHGIEAVCLNDEDEAPHKVNCGAGELFGGFRFWDEPWLLLTENDIYGLQRRRRFQSKHKGAPLQYFTEIKGGDYVVHDVHGIGRYIGVETVEVDGLHRDYLLLQYAGKDRLYVPVDQVGLLHKYVGAEGVTPKLSKMGGAEWRRMKTKASTAITALAEELLRLYAKRKITAGHAFGPDTSFQREFEEKFPYEETPDQRKAVAEIKADMEKPVPMDRLLCGDVGYGKTEVALRAAFKAVMDGKQVAVLVPTTVLAQQHLLTFRERLESFGLRVAMVSRFVSGKQTQEVLRKLEAGEVDILIGTHRILQGDVVFLDLGLLIIDEEQRFGVAQKEKIKQWKQGIDVLALSATPIPRTLHMALVNTRDMSVIESPPEDRLPVETYVAEYSDGMIKEALERELRRGGRIYYVHNRISGLASIAARLRRLVPGIKIRMGHGRMSEEALEDAMMDFYEGRCDVLLSTTIIENGLDVPMANTIIVEGAENFGLSQLYQMRGRVGRSSRLAYAYFVYKKDKVLSEVAAKRLQAIRDFTELGAGFKIAMRDLEIRGAGNLLGPQQHGYIAGIGFAAYCDMLDQTIRRLKDGEAAGETRPDPILEIPRNAYIPDSYISNPKYKLELYRRFADLAWGEADNLMEEIIDRFGTPPEEVEELWHLAQVRALCRRLGIRRASARGSVLRLTFFPKARFNTDYLVQRIRAARGRMRLNNEGQEPYFEYRMSGLDVDPVPWLEKELPRWIL